MDSYGQIRIASAQGQHGGVPQRGLEADRGQGRQRN